MRSKGAALALTLRASKTDFSLPEPTLQAISLCTSNAWKPSRRKPQSATFFARGPCWRLADLGMSAWRTESAHAVEEAPVLSTGGDGIPHPGGDRAHPELVGL
jgi:hypothetical protein